MNLGILFTIFVLIIYIALIIAVIIGGNLQRNRNISITCVVILLSIRIFPNMIIENNYNINPIIYGSGWWIMFLAFVAAIVASLMLYKK